MASLSILGAGNVGTALGLVFATAGHEIVDIFSRSRTSAERAARLIGAGTAVGRLEDLRPAEILLIAVSDNALAELAEALAAAGVVRPGTVVFHCSGAKPAEVLGGLRTQGARVASVHPVKTFTDPERDAETFAGTWCAVEGDADAVARLTALFEGAGAQAFAVEGERKLIYHAANVFLCNYLLPLIEAGFECYERAGVPREVARQIALPILHATVDNALAQGPARALTGPIARGDDQVVAAQLAAVDSADTRLGELYRVMGRLSVELAEQKGAAAPERLEAIRRILRDR